MKKLFANPWIVFSPFLVLFCLIVLKLHTNEMFGDEERYLMFAQNLTHGFYSPRDEINLWNGPGYPLLLLPFVLFKLPLICIPLLNAVLQYLSIILLFKTIIQYTNRRTAYIFSFFWALYYISYQEIPNILTEPFTSFLITLILYSLSRAFNDNSKKFLLISGLATGFLVLTKVIFGYVLFSITFVYLLVLVYSRLIRKNNSLQLKKIMLSLGIALLTIAPYLIYTYSLTGRFPYFANSGGMSLYWMSTPVENEYGEWNNSDFTGACGFESPCNAELFAANHQKDYDYIYQFKGVAFDDACKKLAIQNIKAHPFKYLKNCFANQGRMWFGFPFSYFYQQDKTLIRILPNSILLVFFLGTLFLWLRNFSKVRTELNFAIIFILFYLGFTTLVSATPRHLYVIVPVILAWGAFIHYRSTRIRLNFSELKNNDDTHDVTGSAS